MGNPSKRKGKGKKGGRHTPSSRSGEVSDISAFKQPPVALPLPSGNTCLAKRKGMDAFLKMGIIPNSLMGIIQGQMNEVEGKPQGTDDLQKQLRELAGDADRLNDVLLLSDRVTCQVVLDPPVRMHIWEPSDIWTGPDDDCPNEMITSEDAYGTEEEQAEWRAAVIKAEIENKPAPEHPGLLGKEIEEEYRDPEALYIDEVEMDDKMFIFGWAVGGTADLERFREESAAVLADVPVGEAVGSEA